MKEFIEKLIERLEELSGKAEQEMNYYRELPEKDASCEVFADSHEKEYEAYCKAMDIVNQLAEEYINCSTDTSTNTSSGWIPCSERLPECENKYGWVSCIVSVIRSHYPTSTYDICDSPYDENIVMHANYHVSQKIWHLESDEQLNALMDIEDAPLNGDYVVAWQPLPAPYQPKGE